MKAVGLQAKKPVWSSIHDDASLRMSTPFLAFLSLVYRGGIYLRLKAYRRKLIREQALPGFVISVGNLTAGGTGKTPAVITLAKWAVGQGYRTAILSRGYGGRKQKRPLAVSDGSSILEDASVTGDEPYLMAGAVPGVPVVVFKNRYRAGLCAKKWFGTDIFLLDDGYQHLHLERDLNIALVDANNPFGNGHLLPWGPLREPIGELKRADAVVLTRYKQGDAAGGTEAFLTKRFPKMPLFQANHRPKEVIFTNASEPRPPEFLRFKRVAAFAGIAHPEVFKKTLENLGAEVVAFREFSDHHPYTSGDIRSLIQMKRDAGASFLLTTEKDWVRISDISPAGLDLAYLIIEFAFSTNGERFFQMIRDGLEKR
ncbi:MAG: tetraacyldisaccharide 4'-kinase [Deltaproteobacteria bacterium]